MKNLLISALVGLSMILSGTAFAHGKSELNLKMHDNGAFSVMLNGHVVGQNVLSASIPNIHAGKHELKVMRYFVNPWCGTMVPQVIFSGCITIPHKSKVFSIIAPNNCYQVVNVFPVGHQHGGNYCGGAHSGNCTPACGYNEGNGWGYGNTGYGGYGDGPGSGHGYDPDDGTGWGGGYGNDGGCGPCMAPHMFKQLKVAIESRPFDHTKLEVAQQAMGSNYFTSGQVAELMGLFTFDSYRLSLAKNAYTRTVDKQNYFVVSKEFTFSSNAKELNDYIKKL